MVVPVVPQVTINISKSPTFQDEGLMAMELEEAAASPESRIVALSAIFV